MAVNVDDISSFVRKVVVNSDLSVLTKRMVRDEYKKTFNVDHLDTNIKETINKTLADIISELSEIDQKENVPSGKEKIPPRQTEEESSTISVNGKCDSPKKRNKEKRQMLQKLSPKLQAEDVLKAVLNSPGKVQTPVKTIKKTRKKLSPSPRKPSILRSPKNKVVKSPKFEVKDVLDAVVNNEDQAKNLEESEESDDSSGKSECENRKEDIQSKKNFVDSDTDEENWKPFSPYKSPLTKSNSSESESGSSESENESNIPLKTVKSKKRKVFHLNDDSEADSPIGKISRQKKGHVITCTSDEDSDQDKKPVDVKKRKQTFSFEENSDIDSLDKKKKDEAEKSNTKSKQKDSEPKRRRSFNLSTESETDERNAPTNTKVNKNKVKKKSLSKKAKDKTNADSPIKKKRKRKISDAKNSDSDNLRDSKRSKKCSIMKTVDDDSDDESLGQIRRKKEESLQNANKNEETKSLDQNWNDCDEEKAEEIRQENKSSSTATFKCSVSDVEVSSSSEESDSDNETLATIRKNSKSSVSSLKNKEDSSDDELIQKSSRSLNSYGVEKDVSSSSSDDDEERPLAPKSKAKTAKNTFEHKSKTQKKKKTSLSPKTKGTSKLTSPESGDGYVKKLKTICRACGIFISKKQLEGCDSDRKTIRKLKQILEDAGMEGRPSMSKVEEIRLRREAQELDMDNIIHRSGGRPKRKVNSVFARNSPAQKRVQCDATPPKKVFSRLKGIVDSEESD